jgi:Icc protein
MTVIAQLSDIHIRADADGAVAEEPVDALRAAVSSLLSLPRPPDCVVLTGDLTEHGHPAEYEGLRAGLADLPMPVHPVAGNHDDRGALRAAFGDHAGVAASNGYVQYAVDAGDVRLVCCDSTVPGEPGGALRSERLAWLDDTLAAERERPTVVAMHHPPYALGIEWIDEMGLADRDDFAAVVLAHPQVVRVMCGHVHRGSVSSFAGTIAVTCPSTYQQLRLDLRRPGNGAVTDEPAGYAIHLIDGNSAVTHFARVGDHHPIVEFTTG